MNKDCCKFNQINAFKQIKSNTTQKQQKIKSVKGLKQTKSKTKSKYTALLSPLALFYCTFFFAENKNEISSSMFKINVVVGEQLDKSVPQLFAFFWTLLKIFAWR